MRKIIILMISIILPIIGAVLIGVYDYNIWYDPEGKNAAQLQSDYKKYVIESSIDVLGKTDQEKTEDRIKLFRILENYYYSEEPIYKKDVKTANDEHLFTISIYRNLFWKVNDDMETEKNHYRYEVFVYDVDYDKIKSEFKKLDVPNDSIVDKAEYPYFVMNFYPNNEYNSDEGLITSGTTYTFTMFDEQVINGYKLSDAYTLNLFDYGSNPTKTDDIDAFYTRTLVFYDYSAFINQDSLDNFDECYIKIDTVLGSEENYTLKESLLKDKVTGLTFDKDEINYDDYKQGATSNASIHDTLNNVNIDGVRNYDGWVFTRYLWWQCLIALTVFGLIMTGFYFTFTYEEKVVVKSKKKKK